ncbi:MAG: DUF2786 domain-containing protein [Nannocystaceae bacterium]|nr:DUF2786 domain-containing protein [Nannocystaceae bacterium]
MAASANRPQRDSRAAPAALDRVRKLLALAASPNPHEAALAAFRAQALIEKHRLQAWIDAEQAEAEDPDPIVDARDEPLEVGRRLRRWKIALATTLADANGCVAYTLGRSNDSAIVLVGRSRDRAMVLELWHWLVRRIEWLSATHGAGHTKKWHEAFRIGVVDAVAERLKEGTAEATAALETAALVVVEPARAAHREALDCFVANHLRLGAGRTLRVNAEAWARGKGASGDLELPRLSRPEGRDP